MAPECQFSCSYRSVVKATEPQTCALYDYIIGKLKYIVEIGKKIKIYRSR